MRRKRTTGTFKRIFSWRPFDGRDRARDDAYRHYISASSFIGGPGAAYKYGLGWVLLAMIQLSRRLAFTGYSG